MKIWLIHDGDAILARGISDSDEYSAHFRQTITPGEQLLGIDYRELENLAWLETDADGNLVNQGARD